MNDNEDYASDSDQSDADFCPENEQESDVSIEENDLNCSASEQESNDEEDDTDQLSKTKKSRKKRKNTKKTKKKKKTTVNNITDEHEPVVSNENEQQINPVNEEEEKKKADALWADFLNNVDSSVPSKSKNSSEKIASSSSSSSENSKDEKLTTETKTTDVKPEKIKITQILDFAGEEIKIEKEISADELRRQLPKSSTKASLDSDKMISPVSSNSKKEAIIKQPLKFTPTLKRPATGGLNSILGQVGKKTKISVLEKSKLDWDNFKQKEGLTEELQTFNKGKDGYLERQDFLNRTDLRQFEIESELRKSSRSSKR